MNDNQIQKDETKSASETVSTTYADIEALYFAEIQSKGASTQEIKNVRSDLKSWRDTLKLNSSTSIGDELNHLFEENTKFYARKQKESSKKPSTCSSRVSRIRKFRIFYLKLEKSEFLPENFGKRLRYLLKANGFSATGFARTYLSGEVPATAIKDWCLGTRLPSKQKIPVIRKVEKILDVPPDTLTSTLPPSLVAPPVRADKTSFGKRLQIAVKKKYLVWTEELEEELQDLITFKSSLIPPENMKRSKNGVWTFNNKGEVASARATKSHLECFFGFCSLSDNPDPWLCGLGLSKKQLTIALLTDKDITEKYLTVFKKNRAGNKYNNGFINFISMVTCFLREETGYLYQKPELAKRLGLNCTVEEWQQRCKNTQQRLFEIKSAIKQAEAAGSSEYFLGRDPNEPISDLLKLKNPLLAITSVIKKMLGDVEKLSPKPFYQAMFYRDILLLAMLQANPLRASMIQNMRLDKNLVKEMDGSWWLFFNRRDFKNRRFLKEDYAVRLDTNIYQIIERYIKEFRPRLLRKNLSDIVFINTGTNRTTKVKSLVISVPNLWIIICKRVKQYIPNSVGFGTHAFRHIVATSIIKNDPGAGFYIAAKVLHDHMKTVEQTYAHLKTSEMFEPYNQFLDANWKSSAKEN